MQGNNNLPTTKYLPAFISVIADIKDVNDTIEKIRELKQKVVIENIATIQCQS